MPNAIAAIPSRILTHFTTDDNFSTASPREADTSEYLFDGCFVFWRLAAGKTFKVTDETYTEKKQLNLVTRVFIGITAVLTSALLFIPGLIFLAFSNSHKISHLAIKAEAYRKDGNHEKARECMISALKIDHQRRDLRLWVEKLDWKRAFNVKRLDDAQKELFLEKELPLEQAKVLIKFADTVKSKMLREVCEDLFSEHLKKAVRDDHFKEMLNRLKGLPIQTLKVPNMSFHEARRLAKEIPALTEMTWKTSEQDAKNQKMKLAQFKFAYFYDNRSNSITEIGKKIRTELAKETDPAKFPKAVEKFKNTPITSLVFENDIQKGHLEALKGLPLLKDVTFGISDLTVEDLRVLEECANLNTLTVEGLSCEDTVELQRYLPSCQVTTNITPVDPDVESVD